MATPTTNIAWTIPLTSSSIQHLTKLHKAVPAPAQNQVLVKLTAASLNYRDTLIASRSPSYTGDHKESLVPGTDGAGIIHAVGSSSTWAGKEGTPVILHINNWILGDGSNLRAGQVFGGNQLDGTLQSWMVVDDERVIEAPKNLSSEESCALISAGVTAWSVIRGGLDARLDGGVEPWKGSWKQKRLDGKWVLTQGTGGVSCFAIQIASALGATVIATSSSSSKLQITKSIGATHLINYKETPQWDEEVLRITGGKGVDHVIDVGGTQTLLMSLKSTRRGGLISVVGVLSGVDSLPAEFIPSVLFGAKIVKGWASFSKDSTEEFVRFSEANEIRPIIAKTFEFNETIQELEALQSQTLAGKVVVRISGD